MRDFPYGKAALIIFLLALSSGIWLAFHPVSSTTSTITLWVFAKTHYEAYKRAIPSFEKTHPGVTVDMQLVSGTAVTTRLQAAFWSNLDVPDLVETEISSAGMFFRGPLEHIGFLDLTDRIHKSGLWDRMVQARFAPYTSRGRIFGIPHDVHPVMIAYRRDIFEKEGIDVSKIRTWDDFIAIGKKLTVPNKRYMIELSENSSHNLEVFLFQRGGGYFDSAGNVIFDDKRGLDTMCWYIPLIAGPKKIGNDLGSSKIFTKMMEDGYILCYIAPDWRTKFIEQDVPRVRGKMALMPLPAISEGERRTSTWGGTMIGITKKCKNPDLAWELALHLYVAESELANRFKESNIIPSLKSAWNHDAFREPRPYWSNQKIGELYAKLAPEVPPQYTSPFIVIAKTKLGEAMTECAIYYKQHGEKGFRDFAHSVLKEKADQVRALMRRNPY